jgi:hypothetical protein
MTGEGAIPNSEGAMGTADQGITPMKALYIVSDSRSGSTLLQHLLALQKGVMALGEVYRLEEFGRDGKTCACGRLVDQCPFWTQVLHRVGQPLNKLRTSPSYHLLRRRFSQVIGWSALKFGWEPLARGLLKDERRFAGNCLAIYQAASKITGNQIVVDASKVPSHLLYLYLEGKELLHPIILIRDGRAVVWSKMKRAGLTATQATKGWVNVCRMIFALQRVMPNSGSVFVSYEELCMNPVHVLERILNPVDVSVQSIDLASLPSERHDLGGSPRFHGKNPDKIELDECWRSEMPKDALLTFEKIAGPINRKFGYE